MGKWGWRLGVVLGMSLLPVVGVAQSATVSAAPSVKDLVNTMVEHEREASTHKQPYSYLQNEKSDRTGGHLWTERVVETEAGRVRFLIAEDGAPLPADRSAAERARLANDAAHPEEFRKREKANTDDEMHARQMLELVAKAFVLENLRSDGADWMMDFRPDPTFSPGSSEEKVLHGMSGTLRMNKAQVRLHRIEGKLPTDVTLFGFLATIKAGSHFSTEKGDRGDGQWRTDRVTTDIRGKATLFKIGKNQDIVRTEFVRVAHGLSIADAALILEK